MKSDLIGQALQRYTDSSSLRTRLVRQEAVAANAVTSVAAIAKETEDAFEDRVDKYKAKVHKLRTYILDNYNTWIADYCAEAYNTASELQDYLLAQYGKAGMS